MVSAFKEFPFWWRQIINSQILKMISGTNGYCKEKIRKSCSGLGSCRQVLLEDWHLSQEPAGEGAMLKSTETEVKQKQRERSWGKRLRMKGAPCVQEILENGYWWGKERGRLGLDYAGSG